MGLLGMAAWCMPQQGRGAAPLSVTLTIHDYPPFMGQQLPHGGLLTRLVREAFKLGDVEVTLENVSSNRAITGIVKGFYDGGFGWAHTAERDRSLLYSSNSIYTFRMVFFQRRGAQIAWRSLADLSRYQIGATLGDFYSAEFSRLKDGGTLHVQEAASDAYNMRKLVVGRVDLFPMELEAGKYLIEASLTPAQQLSLEAQENVFSAVPTYLVLRRDLPHAQELIERFDRGYRQLADSGQLARLMDDTRKSLYEAARRPANPLPTK